MGRQKIAPDVAVRFYEDNDNDTLAAKIMEKLPAGTNKGTLLKEALCFYYKEQNKQKNPEQSPLNREEIQSIIHTEVEKSLQDMEKRILIEMSKMFGSIEGQLKSGIIATLPATPVSSTAIVEEKPQEPEALDVPNSTVDFLSTFLPK